MNRSRVVTIATVAATAVMLTLTACGGDEELSTDADEGSATDRSTLVDDLMVVVAGENTPDEGCIRTGLDGFSTEELQTLDDAAADPDFVSGSEPLASLVPAELQDKVADLSNDCIGTMAPEEMVPVDGTPNSSVPPDGGP